VQGLRPRPLNEKETGASMNRPEMSAHRKKRVIGKGEKITVRNAGEWEGFLDLKIT